MTAPDMTTDCPDEETLAALVDGRLDGNARSRVLRHLDRCEECRDAILLVGEVAVEEASEGKVVQGSFGKPAWLSLAAAAAAAIVVLLFVPAVRDYLPGQDPMTKVVQTAETLRERPLEGRFSADFSYRPYSAKRGGENAEKPDERKVDLDAVSVQLLAARLEERVRRHTTPKNLRAAAVAEILSYKHYEERKKAVKMLERAAATEPTPEGLNDLAAAYLAAGDFQRGLETANRALKMKKTPAALWNRALALQLLNHDADAIKAWNEYLAVDRTSSWANEASRKIEFLQSLR